MQIQLWVIASAVLACNAGCHHDGASLSTAPRAAAAQHSPAIGGTHSQPEAISLLGKPLFAPALSPEAAAQRQRELEAAQVEYDHHLHDEDAIIWLGRRLAYLGRYNDAIAAYSNGLAIFPESYKLLRHRGHRYISVRKFDLAIADLQRAAALIENVPDEIEPDGQPNSQNIPTSTLHTNIFYHLGLAHYLRGEYEAAADAYEKCMASSKNDDMRIATIYWHFLTLCRLKRDDAALQVLEMVQPTMNIIENEGYHELLLMFKNGRVPELNTNPAGGDASIDLATTGYGVGMWHVLRGELKAARKQFQAVIDSTNWAAFGHIAAEVELARQAVAE